MNERKYDIWLNWAITEKCNINCEYCCIDGLIKKNAQITSINIPALIRTLDNTGKIFKVEFTGGEPLMIPNIVEAMVELSQKHYLMISTNLLSQKIERICKEIDPGRFCVINASMHLNELEKHRLVEKYLETAATCRDRGFPIQCLIVGYPPLLEKIERYKKAIEALGLICQILPYFGMYNNKRYPESYTKSELEEFHITEGEYEGEKRFFQKGRICNAGYNVVTIKDNGNIYPCHKIRKSLGNIYTGFTLGKKLIKCPSDFCPCPFSIFDPYLLKIALQNCAAPGITSSRLRGWKILLPKK